jgi:uncharacterized protein YkwD
MSSAALAATVIATAPPVFAQASANNLLCSDEQALIDATNADRAANGQPALQFDSSLLEIARQRAQSQLGTQPLNHFDDSGQLVFAQLLNQAKVTYHLAGENLARTSAADADLTYRVEEALMQSPEHRQNILQPTFKLVAIGAATDPATNQIAFAEEFRDQDA